MKRTETTRKAPPPHTMHRPSRSHAARTSTDSGSSLPLQELLPRLVRGVALSAVFSALLCAVLLILSAAILHTRPDPHAALGGTAAAILLLCALTGGMITARTAGSRALLCGACSAAMSFLLCWIASLCTTGEVALYTRGITLALRGAVVLFALLGASLGLNFPRKR